MEGDFKKFNSLIKCFNGIIFVIGLIGFGKIIILYVGLNLLNCFDCKIIIVEDFVEYYLFGIN